jgi:hypothetical protein
MSGILDSQTRVFDVLVTQEGKRQIAAGDLRICYASFSDDSTFYKEDLVSGSEDTSNRIFFEASNLPQDAIMFEANDSGRLQSFKNINGINVSNGQIITNTSQVMSGTILSGSTNLQETSTGAAFSSLADDLLQSSIDNFKLLRVIGSHESLLDDDQFVVSTNDITFTINVGLPIPNKFKTYNQLTNVEGLISDPRLSNAINFKFLPPHNKLSTSITTNLLGNYVPMGLLESLSINDIVQEIDFYDKSGFSKEIRFNRTSQKNNIVGQFFEISNSDVKKLDVIDYGRHPWNDNQTVKWWHVFFVGKVFVDQNGDDTFIHLFTVVFS